ncbi:hypothetical protein [Streptomyces sp. NPDC048639]
MAALMLLGVVLGAVTHVPVPVAVIAAAVIIGWLAFYGIRKRTAHHRHG